MRVDVGTTGGVAGAASTEEPAKLRISVRCEHDRPEYADNMQGVLTALGEALADDNNLQRALFRLSQDSTFVIVVEGAIPRRIILPVAAVIK